MVLSVRIWELILRMWGSDWELVLSVWIWGIGLIMSGGLEIGNMDGYHLGWISIQSLVRLWWGYVLDCSIGSLPEPVGNVVSQILFRLLGPDDGAFHLGPRTRPFLLGSRWWFSRACFYLLGSRRGRSSTILLGFFHLRQVVFSWLFWFVCFYFHYFFSLW